MKKITRMTYPDWTVHEVEIVEYVPIMLNGTCFYIVVYYDHFTRSNMITLITNYNDVWYKVPLNDEGYNYLSSYIENNRDRALNVDDYELIENIGLAQPMDLMPPSNNDGKINKKPRLVLRYYVPINTNAVSNVRDTIFRSNGCRSQFDKDLEYNYRKDYNNPIIDYYLNEGFRHYYINNHNVKEYDFTAEIPPNTYGSRTIYLEDGTARTQLVLCIPGTYDCFAYYSDFINQSDYVSSRRSQNIEISADYDLYNDLHDIDKVWRDGGLDILDMDFDDPDRTNSRRY